MLIQKYKHTCGDEKWVKETDPKPGKDWTPIKGQAKYMKKKAEVVMEKKSTITGEVAKNIANGAGGHVSYATKALVNGAATVIGGAIGAGIVSKSTQKKEEKLDKKIEKLEKLEKKANKYLEKIAGPVSKVVKDGFKLMETETPSKAANLRKIVGRMSISDKKGYLATADGGKLYPSAKAKIKITPAE